MGKDDSATLAALKAHRHELIDPKIAEYGGRIVKTTGDGLLLEFPSVVDAVRCAVDVQRGMAERNAVVPAGECIEFRIGINVGDIISDGGDIFGEGVNIAARLESIAPPGGICISDSAHQQVQSKADVEFIDLGEQILKNIGRPVRTFRARFSNTIDATDATSAPVLPTASGAVQAERLSTPNNLPQQRTRFIGRKKDLDECSRLLAHTRLLTLTGIGGVGKTRMALQLAQQLLTSYPDGVWFVDLAPVQDALRVTLATANALGVHEEPGKPLINRLVQHAAMQRTLIVLDNCEHVVDAAADLTDTLLSGCAYLKIVATSREGLSIGGEQTLGVRSLAMPANTDMASLQASDAMQLFMDRAHIVNAAVVLDAATGPAIADICRRLDGIPLAIELAAARMKVLKVDEIRARLNERFRLLIGGNRALPRQQTLLATIQWSHDHLTPPEQRLLRLLSVFAGGWTLAGAAAVTGGESDEFDVLDTLTRLVDKSLISVDRAAAGDSRYTMLDTVRQYALDRLEESGEGDLARTQHLTFFLALAKSAADELYGPNQAPWASRLDAEHENMLAAHAWCNRGPGQAQAGLELVAALAPFWRMRGQLELGERTTAEALARDAANRSTFARCRALEARGRFSFLMGRYAETLLCGQERLAIARALDDRSQISEALQALVGTCNALGDLVQARGYLEDGLATAQELGGRWLRGMRIAMAELLRREGIPEAAEPIYAENLALAREQRDRYTFASALINLAIVSVQRGVPECARVQLLEALTIPEIEMKPFALMTLDIGASLAALMHEWSRAALFHGAATLLMRQIHHQHEPVDNAVILPLIAQAREALGETAFAAAQAEGQALSRDHALTEMRMWLRGQNHNLGGEPQQSTQP
jgi:predicted ATPase